MSRHDVVIVKDTHRGLLYEDGVFRDTLPAGRYHIPRQPSGLASFFGAKATRADVVLVDVRWRDRTVVVADFLTADGATISATFALQYRVVDARLALHEARNFEDRAFAETQSAARRVLRGMSLEEVLGGRDEIGEELLRQVAEAVTAFGLEVSRLDFKDLVIPSEIRAVMNRAVLAKRLRQAQPAGMSSAEDDRDFDDEADFDEEADLHPGPVRLRPGSIRHARRRALHHPPPRRPRRHRPEAQRHRPSDPSLRRYRS